MKSQSRAEVQREEGGRRRGEIRLAAEGGERESEEKEKREREMRKQGTE